MTNDELPLGLIREEVLRRLSADQAAAAFSTTWPVELRERWPAWMKEAIDRAERLAAEAYSHGFKTAVREMFGAIKDDGVARSR